MRILISGIAGYIPSYLTGLLLINGHTVIGVDNGFGRTADNLIPYASHPNFTFIKGDIGDKKLLQNLPKFDIAVLCHALVGEPLCNKFPALASYTNVDTFVNYLEAFPHIPIVYTSTGSVYGKIDGVCTEQSPCNPLSLYAITKKKAEELIQEKANYSVIYRFATAMGSATSSYRGDLLVNDLTYQAVKNRTLTLFQADFRRTFCHVRDLADSLYFAIENHRQMAGNIFNVGKKENNWSKRKLAEYIKEKTNCTVFYADEGYKDTDLRDYDTSFTKINNLGWYASISVEQTIDELLKVVPMLDTTNRYNLVG